MDNLDENALTIYTDGSSYSNPRKGGVGYVFVWIGEDGHEQSYCYQAIGYRNATNQQMELQACIEALNFVNSKGSDQVLDFTRFTKIVIRTDSRYVEGNYNNALYYWPKQHWMNKDGKPIVNAELWKTLTKHTKKSTKRVYFEWVKAHSKSQHNKQADKLAKLSANTNSKRQLTYVNVRRKKSTKSVEAGSVHLRGQRITIRIISDEWQKPQKCYRCKYEVMSIKSPYYQNVDWIYSTNRLKAGHSYFVKLGNNSKAPWIEKIYHEK